MAGSIITNNGHKITLNRTWKATPDYSAPSKFSVGVGTTNPISTDTDLEKKVPLFDYESVDECEATTGWTDSADMTVSVNNSIFVLGSNALNLTKDGTGSASASTSKTTTNITDFTSKKLEFFIYVADSTVLAQLAATDCLTVRFGTDSSNYYQWTRDSSQLSVGWNYINNMTSANADSSTGSPGTSNMDYTFIQLTATASSQTWVAGKIIIDDIRVASSDDFIKSFESGYPSLDETNFEATVRCLLLSTEANGQEISEFGLFNTDATPLMFSRATFTPITKDDSTQIIFVEQDSLS